MNKTLGELEQAALFALLHLERRRSDDCYSMGIRDEIERRSGRRISLGALYTVLDRMEGHGLVSSSLGDSTAQRGGRRKKMIRIEAAGVRALDESVERFRRMSQGQLQHLRQLAESLGSGSATS